MSRIQHYRQQGSKPVPDRLLYGELAVAKDGRLFVGNGAGVPVGAGQGTFDQVIRTQAEFQALIASPTWLGAESVCFIGNGGGLKFTRSDGKGIKIPQTVKQIQGLNSATIEVTEFVSIYNGDKAALWYQTLPTSDDYWVDGMTVNFSSNSIYNRGNCFFNCKQMSNCTGNGLYEIFSSCVKLSNCIASSTGIVSGTNATGFCECKQLTGCTGTGSGSASGFNTCEQLANCTGYCNAIDGYTCAGFSRCTKLDSCTGSGSGDRGNYGFCDCTQLTHCTGTGSGFGSGFGDCEQLTACRGSCNATIGNQVCAGFSTCTQLTDCVGKGSGDSLNNGFYKCTQLSNCTGTSTSKQSFEGNGFRGCTQLTDCTGIGTNTSAWGGNGFCGCAQLTNCIGGGTNTAAPGGNGFLDCTQLTKGHQSPNLEFGGRALKGYAERQRAFCTSKETALPTPRRSYLFAFHLGRMKKYGEFHGLDRWQAPPQTRYFRALPRR